MTSLKKNGYSEEGFIGDILDKTKDHYLGITEGRVKKLLKEGKITNLSIYLHFLDGVEYSYHSGKYDGRTAIDFNDLEKHVEKIYNVVKKHDHNNDEDDDIEKLYVWDSVTAGSSIDSFERAISIKPLEHCTNFIEKGNLECRIIRKFMKIYHKEKDSHKVLDKLKIDIDNLHENNILKSEIVIKTVNLLKTTLKVEKDHYNITAMKHWLHFIENDLKHAVSIMEHHLASVRSEYKLFESVVSQRV